MRIQTNATANAAYKNLSVTGMQLSKSIEKLSSGFRINRSGDDASGLSIANSLRSEGKALSVASRNATQGQSVLDIADGSANEITKIVDRLRELTATSASANTSDSERTSLNAEFQQLAAEISRTVQETSYQGTALVDGSFSSQNFRVGTDSGSTIAVTVGSIALTALGLSSTTSISTSTLASAALITIAGSSQTQLNSVIGQIGAAQNRFEYAVSTLAVRIANVSAAESVIRDLDIASETTKFTKFQVLQQAGTAMLAQANQLPQGVLSLLR